MKYKYCDAIVEEISQLPVLKMSKKEEDFLDYMKKMNEQLHELMNGAVVTPADADELDRAMGVNYSRKCECGAEKAKSIGHSSWCPKYEG